MVPLLVSLAFVLPAQASPSPVPVPSVAVGVTTTAEPGGDTGGFTLNPWTNFKRDLRRSAQQSFEHAAAVMEAATSTPDLGATPYLQSLWGWGRTVVMGTGILVLAVVASAAAGMWPGLNRYAAGAVLPRVVVAVALVAAGPMLLSYVSAAANGISGEAAKLMPSVNDVGQSVAVMAELPLVLTPFLIVSSFLIAAMGIVRSFLLAMFVAFGPFANASFAWPGVDRWGKSWWRSVVVLAVVLPAAQAVVAGVTFHTLATLSLTGVTTPAAWQQALFVLVAVVFQALVPLGLVIFALRPVNATVGVREGARMWRAVKAVSG